MKFCYIDESGTGEEPYAIMVGIIVDSQRMHITKQDWANLLEILSKITNKGVKEFHTRDFYKGKKIWYDIKGPMRARIITAILDWLIQRKHKISFNGIDKEYYFANYKQNQYIKDLKSLWCMLGLHQLLILQKTFQKEKKNKGNIIVIFDSEVKEETKFGELVKNPPAWTDFYYNRDKKQKQFDQIIDVPYYGDSEDVNLIQVADLVAYILRLYIELKENKSKPSYKDEEDRLDEWMEKILNCSLPRSTRYPSSKRDICSELFKAFSPKTLINLG